MADYLPWGDALEADELKIAAAKRLLKAVPRWPFASLLGCVRREDREGVVLEFVVERPQRPPVAIEPRERVAVLVTDTPGVLPDVRVLRGDFPETPHQNRVAAAEPRSICFVDQSPSDVSSWLTPERLLQRISEWLARAAAGRLHLDAQALEPFVMRATRVVVHEGMFATDGPARGVALVPAPDGEADLLLAAPIDLSDANHVKHVKLLLLCLEATPTDGAVIHHHPSNFAELADLLDAAGVNLPTAIQAATTALQEHDDPVADALLEKEWVILVRLPRARPGGAVEHTELIAFWMQGIQAGPLGVEIGFFGGKHNGKYGVLVGAELKRPKIGTPIAMSPVLRMTRGLASRLAGAPESPGPAILSVGAGALGSQVAMNLVRQGIGSWTFVDTDRFLPHNLARHALGPGLVGHRKASALAYEVKCLLGDAAAAKSHVADVTSNDGSMGDSLKNAERILDFSASPSALASIARVPSTAPRLSAYLVDGGLGLVMLAEDATRESRIDDLDAQLAADCATMPELDGLLEESATEIRYSGTCADVTVVLPQDVVGLHAGIAARFAREWIRTPTRAIGVWRLDPDELSVRAIKGSTPSFVSRTVDGWEVRVSEDVLRHLWKWRSERLPRETGGVLVGATDCGRRVTYITLARPSPTDSDEWPTHYRRGIVGLTRELTAINRKSGNRLDYVGEWHSHPCGVSPSELDQEAHEALAEELAATGLPGIVLIVGDHAWHAMLTPPELAP